MEYHVYLVARDMTKDNHTNDLPTHIRMNKSRSVTFEVPNSLSCYTDEPNPWIVVYEDENVNEGITDLSLELGGSGYKIVMCLDAFDGILYMEDVSISQIGIDRLFGFVAFKNFVFGRDMVELFKTEFNPVLFQRLINQEVQIHERLFEVESNIEYLANYICSLVKYEGYLDEKYSKIISERILNGDINYLTLISFINVIDCDNYDYIVDLLSI